MARDNAASSPKFQLALKVTLSVTPKQAIKLEYSMISRKLAITGTVAACAACCAPLVVPLVWPVLVAAGLVGAGSAGGGWLAGLSVDAILCGGIALAAMAGGVVWFRQRRKRLQTLIPDLSKGSQCDLDTCGPSTRSKADA
jgi:hypothetical protein